MKKAIALALALTATIAFGQSKVVHKFGFAPDFDSTDGNVTIWDGANDAGINNMVYDYPSSAVSMSLSSSSAADTNITVNIQGLDSNSNLVTQTGVLNGTNEVVLSTSMYRVFRAFNANSTETAGTVYISKSGETLTAGVPVASNCYALFTAANQQTEMAVYTVPNTYKGKMKSIYFGINSAPGTISYTVSLWKREPGGVWRLQWKTLLDDSISGFISYEFIDPLEFSAGTDIELRVTTSGTAKSVVGGFEIEIEKIVFF